MAAPSNVDLNKLSGTWVMNKSLSDDTDAILAMQGVGWFLRRAIALATVTLHIKVYRAPASASPSSSSSPTNLTAAATSIGAPQADDDDSPVTHIDIEQTATGGIKGTTELRTLDWTARPHADYLFGKLEGKSRWVDLDDPAQAAELPDEFLTRHWLRGDGNGGGPNGRMQVQAYVRSLERDWQAQAVWGFETVDDKRYHTRHVVVNKASDGTERRAVRLVYDFVRSA